MPVTFRLGEGVKERCVGKVRNLHDGRNDGIDMMLIIERKNVKKRRVGLYRVPTTSCLSSIGSIVNEVDEM